MDEPAVRALFACSLMVTARTVILDREGFLAIVTSPAILAGVQVIHGYLDGPLFHLGKDFRVVTVRTVQSGILVHCPVEYHGTHRAPCEFQRLARPDRKSTAASNNR